MWCSGHRRLHGPARLRRGRRALGSRPRLTAPRCRSQRRPRPQGVMCRLWGARTSPVRIGQRHHHPLPPSESHLPRRQRRRGGTVMSLPSLRAVFNDPLLRRTSRRLARNAEGWPQRLCLHLRRLLRPTVPLANPRPRSTMLMPWSGQMSGLLRRRPSLCSLRGVSLSLRRGPMSSLLHRRRPFSVMWKHRSLKASGCRSLPLPRQHGKGCRERPWRGQRRRREWIRRLMGRTRLLARISNPMDEWAIGDQCTGPGRRHPPPMLRRAGLGSRLLRHCRLLYRSKGRRAMRRRRWSVLLRRRSRASR